MSAIQQVRANLGLDSQSQGNAGHFHNLLKVLEAYQSFATTMKTALSSAADALGEIEEAETVQADLEALIPVASAVADDALVNPFAETVRRLESIDGIKGSQAFVHFCQTLGAKVSR